MEIPHFSLYLFFLQKSRPSLGRGRGSSDLQRVFSHSRLFCLSSIRLSLLPGSPFSVLRLELGDSAAGCLFCFPCAPFPIGSPVLRESLSVVWFGECGDGVSVSLSCILLCRPASHLGISEGAWLCQP